MSRKIEDYRPYNGFYDLRDCQLPKKVFITLWKAQEALNYMRNRAKYHKKQHPQQWQKAKELSGDYQHLLFKYTGGPVFGS